MKVCTNAVLMLLTLVAAPAFATVTVSSPANGTTVGSTAQFVATGTTTCKSGVTAMGVYIDNNLMVQTQGASLNTSVAVGAGSHRAVVEEWDACGAATTSVLTLTSSSSAGVHVSTPATGSTVAGNVSFVATATSTCAQGVASMGVYDNNSLVKVTSGATFNQQLALAAGTHNAVVQEWDNCGGSQKAAVTVNVAATTAVAASSSSSSGTGTTVPSGATKISQIQTIGSWNQWAEFPPNYDICESNCPGLSFSMTQNVSSPSTTGKATKFTIGGTDAYSDVLWSNKLIGQGTTTNQPDTAHNILPNINNMQYDTYVYVTSLTATQDLEFDANIYLNGDGMEWGTECNNLDGKDWDVWDNVNAKWISTGLPCNLVVNQWNHVTLQFQRGSGNTVIYKSITLNGTTYNVNQTYPPMSVPAGWYGLTVNYQMDGNYQMATDTTYVDNFSLTYW